MSVRAVAGSPTGVPAYLASGRPVFLQDTVLSDWLTDGEGIAMFSYLDSMVRGIEAINANFQNRRRVVRSLVAPFFGADWIRPRSFEATMG